MSLNEQMIEMQSQSIEQMKNVQTQVAEFNERIADSMVAALPEVPTPFSDYMPNPTELVANYFDYLGEMRDANRDFMERMVKAWDREPATSEK